MFKNEFILCLAFLIKEASVLCMNTLLKSSSCGQHADWILEHMSCSCVQTIKNPWEEPTPTCGGVAAYVLGCNVA